IEDNCGAMFARSLCLNKIAEFIQLEIRGKNAAHTPSQRRAQGDHRRADTERSIWWRNERAVSLLRIAVPASFSGVVAIIPQIEADRKSTRLNSSHLVISYAVFCLKKKKKKKIT